MFSSNLLEAQTNRVYLPNIDFKTLSDVINYAYSGSISLNVNNVQSVFQLASLFQIKDLFNACCVFMDSKLDITNCLDVHLFGKQHMCEHLITKSKEFVARHFNEIIKTREFIEIEDVDLLVDVLACDELEVASEEIVIEALLVWLKHDPNRRRTHLERIFSRTIRFGLLDSAYLSELMRLNETLLQPISNQISKRLKELSISSNIGQLEDKPRAGMAKAQMCFLLIGGSPDSSDGTYVNCFNPFNGEKYFFSTEFLDKQNYPDSRGYFHVEYPGVCVTEDNRVFVAGGLYVFHKNKMLRKQTTPRKFNNTASIETTGSSNDENNQDLQDGN